MVRTNGAISFYKMSYIRKHPNKEYIVILEFVNYKFNTKKNFTSVFPFHN